MEVSSLADILASRQPEVARICALKLKLSTDDCAHLFLETKKFLWLQARLRIESKSGAQGLPRGIFMFDALQPLDEMWHQFILCTESYMEFCDRFLGGYIHHQPLSLVEHYGGKGSDDELKATVRGELVLQCRYIANHLGPDTLEYWYKGLARRYATLCPVN